MHKLWIENIDLIGGQLEWMTFEIQKFAAGKDDSHVCTCGVSNNTFSLNMERIGDYREGVKESDRLEVISCKIEKPQNRQKEQHEFIVTPEQFEKFKNDPEFKDIE